MRTACVIAEYNPFHKGHALQLRRLREERGFDHVVVIMSGNFVQRGAPSLVSKYERAEMALGNGADLVIELPVDFALANAGTFAEGGVLLAKHIGAADTIAWSCEDPELFGEAGEVVLRPLIRILTEEPAEYKSILRERLSSGLSYPKAREEALLSLPEMGGVRDELHFLLGKPNNLLGLSYETAVRSLTPELSTLALRREGSGHDTSGLDDEYPSASALRKAALEGTDISSVIPEKCRSVIEKAAREKRLAEADDFSMLLRYRLLDLKDPTDYRGVTPSLAAKLKKIGSHFSSVSELTEKLKTREVTRSHISRALFSILLDLKKEDMPLSPSYARILGLRREAEELMHEIRQKTSVPLISKDADYSMLLQKELHASEVYRLIMEQKSGHPIKNDLEQPLIVL